MALGAFAIVVSILFGFLFVVWKKDDLINVFLKSVFFFMTIWSVIETLIVLGIL